jgi:hypothetical protein
MLKRSGRADAQFERDPTARRARSPAPPSTRQRATAKLRAATEDASVAPRDSSFATVPTVASTALPCPPATTELCALHNRRLLTDDRGFASSRLPAGRISHRRRRRSRPAASRSVAESCPATMSRLADGRQRCASPTTRGCRLKREQSLLAASLWLLAQEPDLDPARVPEATGTPIRRHRRRDRNRLDGAGDQPSPSRY